jgi:D-tyrosyl-tRNA(Tyr) deacylase
MKFVIQRVKKAICRVDGQVTGSIQEGLFVLIGFKIGDDDSFFERSIQKILNLRVFEDEKGAMNSSLLDAKKQLLVVSQFTLYGDAMKGNRPSFMHSMDKEQAKGYYDLWMQRMQEKLPDVQAGIFSADMQIEMVADGPVTILLEY